MRSSFNSNNMCLLSIIYKCLRTETLLCIYKFLSVSSVNLWIKCAFYSLWAGGKSPLHIKVSKREKKSRKNWKPTALSWMCSYIFHALDSQVIKQHSDTSVIYYPDWFPTSFNQTLLKPADSERNPSFSPLCLCLSPPTSFCSLAFLSLCLLYSYFPKRLFHMCLGPGGS